MTTLEYQLETDLIPALIIAGEIENETGLTPKYITTDTDKLKYNPNDVHEFIHGQLTEQEYIDRNKD